MEHKKTPAPKPVRAEATDSADYIIITYDNGREVFEELYHEQDTITFDVFGFSVDSLEYELARSELIRLNIEIYGHKNETKSPLENELLKKAAAALKSGKKSERIAIANEINAFLNT